MARCRPAKHANATDDTRDAKYRKRFAMETFACLAISTGSYGKPSTPAEDDIANPHLVISTHVMSTCYPTQSATAHPSSNPSIQSKIEKANNYCMQRIRVVNGQRSTLYATFTIFPGAKAVGWHWFVFFFFLAPFSTAEVSESWTVLLGSLQAVNEASGPFLSRWLRHCKGGGQVQAGAP